MFTIKATYRGQIRKYTFSNANTFPSYDQICAQIYRVFPIDANFYLSKLLFSPDANQQARILLSKEVRTIEDYNRCIQHFHQKNWRNALLRFSVHDIDGSSAIPRTPSVATFPPVRRNSETQGHPQSAFPFSSFLVTPPPVVFSSVPSASTQGPMDVDPVMLNTSDQAHDAQPKRPVPQHRLTAPGLGSCCSVSQGKAEIHTMMTDFQENLNRVMVDNFSTSGSSTVVSSTPRNSAFHASSASAPPPSLCSVCVKNITCGRSEPRSWYSCENCHVVVCVTCHNQARPGFCLSTMGPHKMKLAIAPSDQASSLPIPHLPSPWTPHTGSSAMPTPLPSTTSNSGASGGENVAPIVHMGVLCDACDKTIEGVRHKCLDCPDYDLCTPCIASGSAESHNPFHEFFDVSEPGRVIVHTVFSGDGERETANRPSRTSAPERDVVHLASCDLCDSRISGARYKCLDCPDFDACSACFSITAEQHPHHSFARISKKEDYVRRQIPRSQMHYATCNACSKTIYNVRFKCMHPECPDYDLCEACESHPIALHPAIHPLLKIKAPETVIPTVYRVGQVNLVAPVPSVPLAPVSFGSRDSHSRSSSREGPTRSPTPTARSLPSKTTSSKEAVEHAKVQPVPSPKPPKLPPKPEMMSQPPWASIPGFFQSAIAPVPPPFPTIPGTFPSPGPGNPFIDSPYSLVPVPPAPPPMPSPPTFGSFVSRPKPVVEQPAASDNKFNPWPTTNPAERQELLQLIADFSAIHREDAVPAEKSRVPELVSLTADAAPTPVSVQARKPTPPAPATPPKVPEFDTRNSSFEEMKSSFQAKFPKLEDSWPNLSKDMTHLLHDLDQLGLPIKQSSGSAVENENENPFVTRAPSIAESTLSGEALLKRPEIFEDTSPVEYNRSLSDLIKELPSLVPVKAPTPGTPPVSAPAVDDHLRVDKAQVQVPETRIPLSSAFIEDVTVPDGQVFPPGAEFVKCWRLVNDSGREWPENTSLVFVAGESLSAENKTKNKSDGEGMEVGKVKAGTEVDVWTGELKAPEVPGRYVGYWRLQADGELFGNNLWIEINVVESDVHHSSDESMACSSIIMPSISPSSQGSAAPTQHVPSVSTTAHGSSITGSGLTTEDGFSDVGSDHSSLSLISVPDEDEDDVLWHDSRSYTTADLAAAAAGQASTSAGSVLATPASDTVNLNVKKGKGPGSAVSAMEYVMLYDENSSEEE